MIWEKNIVNVEKFQKLTLLLISIMGGKPFGMSERSAFQSVGIRRSTGNNVNGNYC